MLASFAPLWEEEAPGAHGERRGPLVGQVGILGGMRPRERVLVLLQLLGAAQRVELGADDIEAV
jgi:hypothetical protein